MGSVSSDARSLRGELDQYTTALGHPSPFGGRGVVTCAGGLRYNICAWVLIRMLRQVGCPLPIEVWYLGDAERDDEWIRLVEPFGVTCREVTWEGPGDFHPRAHGWASKSHAIVHSAFSEVLFLDADNVPLVNPEFLFEQPEFLQTGAIFWPDGGICSPENPLWEFLGLEGRSERDFESGQMLIDKRRAWRAVQVANWFNQHAEFFYQHVYGDKDTFRFAWHFAEQDFAMPERGMEGLRGTLCQHDFSGRRIFQHRCYPKWSLRRNVRVAGFEEELIALQFLEELRRLWNPVRKWRSAEQDDAEWTSRLLGRRFRVMNRLVRRGRVELGEQSIAHHHPFYQDAYWWVEANRLGFLLADQPAPFRLSRDDIGTWRTEEMDRGRPAMQLIPC